jgi:hypothetical protein
MTTRSLSTVCVAALIWVASCAAADKSSLDALQPPVPVRADTWTRDYATAREQWIE